MAEVTYYLRNPKAVTKTSICLSFRYEGLRLQCSTGWSISPNDWNFKKNYPRHQIKQYQDYHQFLESIRQVILKNYNEARSNGKIPEPSFLKEIFNNSLNKKSTKKSRKGRREVEKKEVTFFEGYLLFLEIQKDTKAERTLKKYKTIYKLLQDFQKTKRWRLTFKSIDIHFYDQFKRYLLNVPNPKSLTGIGQLDDTIAKNISTVKTYMQWSLERGYHDNTSFHHFKTTRKPKQDIISLSAVELESIYNYDFSKDERLEKVRDLFCFGCFTGQRWSDVEAFQKVDLKGDSWEFISIKTKKRMVIPLIGYCERAKVILEKYDFELPKMTSQKFNEYLKEVGKNVGINSDVSIVRFSGNKKVVVTKPKYEFMSSHMARRTAVTLLLQKGVPPTTVMKLTGHSDLRTLMKYENTSQDALRQALEGI